MSPEQYEAQTIDKMTAASIPSLEPSKSRDAVASDIPGDGIVDCEEAPATDDHINHSPKPHRHVLGSGLITQAVRWLHNETAKRTFRRATAQHDIRHGTSKQALHTPKNHPELSEEKDDAVRLKATPDKSDRSDGLDKPEQSHAQNSLLETKMPRRPSNRVLSRKSSRLFRSTSPHPHLIRRTGSFDTDYFGEEVLVPSCGVYLDNTKTLSNEDEGPESNINSTSTAAEASKNSRGWLIFKDEILRLVITLRLKGWRRVPLDRSNDITVQRLSGALTNAVYVVYPPKNLEVDGTASATPRKPPPNLLLRIYGPQVEHLIDRESELQNLRRLARKNIGPRLLGIFNNGRFEEYLHARALTPKELRDPDISKQIAKRMRELHDGIELLEEERDGGPTVWKNWDKWVERAAQVISWTDMEFLLGAKPHHKSRLDAWRKHGLICGVEWPRFRQAVETYRAWLVERLGGLEMIKKEMVFAHNDTQYGNILRLEPRGESPLLLPTNEHKRLIVIDFEYASANTPGFEFANHFTEWCYNYHDPHRPYALTESNYPTVEEQRRFLHSYIEHNISSSSNHPTPNPLTVSKPHGPSPSISAFGLDGRSPTSQQLVEEDSRREEVVERLMYETRLWRAANSARWIAWGVVQAIMPDMEEMEKSYQQGEAETSSEGRRQDVDDNDKEEEEEEEEEEAGFDYLGYAHERALFFWGDLISLGIVSKEDLPRELLEKIKYVDR